MRFYHEVLSQSTPIVRPIPGHYNEPYAKGRSNLSGHNPP
jgi:hypothetical protein